VSRVAISWDLDFIHYDAARYPFAAWLAEQIEVEGIACPSLDRLHEAMPVEAVAPLVRQLGRATQTPEFRQIYFAFVRDVLQPLVGREVALQRFVNVRILVPDRPEMCVPFHTDAWYGHGSDERNLWLPLVPVWGSNGLQVVDRETSEQLVGEAIRRRLRVDEMHATFLPASRPVTAGSGQALLFTPHHLHGALTNTTGRTRVSIDFRLAVAGGRLGRKLIGGYFSLLD